MIIKQIALDESLGFRKEQQWQKYCLEFWMVIAAFGHSVILTKNSNSLGLGQRHIMQKDPKNWFTSKEAAELCNQAFEACFEFGFQAAQQANGFNLSNALKNRMQQFDLDVVDLSEMAKVDQQTIQKMLTGEFVQPQCWFSVIDVLQLLQSHSFADGQPIVKLVLVTPLPNYQLHLRYEDGIEGTISVKHFCDQGIFKAWVEQPGLFEQVRIQGTALVWNEAISLDGIKIYNDLANSSVEIV